MAAEKPTESAINDNLKPPKALPVTGEELNTLNKKETSNDEKWEKSRIDIGIVRQEFEKSKKNLTTKKQQIKKNQEVREFDFSDWSSPFVEKPWSGVLLPKEASDKLTASQEDDSLTKLETEFVDTLKKKHDAEIRNIIETGDVGNSARAVVYRELMTWKNTEDAIRIALTTDKKFITLKPEEQKKAIEKALEEKSQVIITQLEEYRKLGTDKQADKKSEITKLAKESLGLENVDSLFDDKNIQEKIIKNIQEKWTRMSGIDPEKGLWPAIAAEQRKTFESYKESMGEKFSLQSLPVDIRQRLIFEDPALNTSLLKEVYWEDIPDKVEREIFRSKREIFRQKEDETDSQYTQRAQKDLKKATGLTMAEVSRNDIKLSPFIKFLADLLAPFWAMMGWASGDFWRSYLKQKGTPEQQKKWSKTVAESYWKEGETVSPKNRASHEKNLKSYQGCDKPDLLNTNVAIMRANQGKYELVASRLSEKTGGKKKIPWEVIAAIHYREGDMDFHTYLHNGDRLWTPTTSEPKGITFPDTEEGWVDAAVNALGRESYLDNMTTGSLEWLANIAEYSEKYNGPAFRNQGKNSPYVWAGAKGISVAWLIKIDHWPITDEADKRLGIMPIIMELAGYTQGGKATSKQKGIADSPNSSDENAGKNPAQWFRDNAGKKYGKGNDKDDCMTSTNTALWLPYEHHIRTFGSQYILQEKNGEKVPQDLWNVSMAAAIYTGKLQWPTRSSSKEAPIIQDGDGWYGWREKASNPDNMEYYIEENVMKRVREQAKKIDVLWNGLLMHYSQENQENTLFDIKNKLQDGESAMMWATGNGTNQDGHEWLVTNEWWQLMVYESTSTSKEDWRGAINGISGTWLPLDEYLQNRSKKYPREAIIFAKKGH